MGKKEENWNQEINLAN